MSNAPVSADGTQPEILDVLVVGGGPAGTAAAFRLKELGLRALLIDFDDILKRIRDYPKDKLILPDFGGGDKMAFPSGGACVSALPFAPIDKDDMCARWKDLYTTFDVPVRTGIEISAVERDGDLWNVRAWDLKNNTALVFRARHVVLAIGRGVPRRLDLAGNMDGIVYRMDDPARYVPGPVLVVGGGTSAAEAVLAISLAKIAADEKSAVYWAFRGTKMPAVSKALAERFFEAYIGNGNIRSLPNAEPASVVTGPDRLEYVSLRVDRKTVEGRPPETMHLEFAKTSCIACIGEDIPEALLKSLGIAMIPVGEFKKMVVTPLLETQQPNIYLIGDLLSQSYLETDDFSASPDTYREVKHRGNIKTSLRDGVFVADVIQQRMEGRSHIEVNVGNAEPLAVPAADPRVAPLTAGGASGESPPRPDVDVTRDGATLVLITPTGVEAGEYRVTSQGTTTLGRIDRDVSFPNDTSLSDTHASISHRDGVYYLRDDGSRSGTYLRLQHDHPVVLTHGDLLRVGRQILVIVRATRDATPTVEHYDSTGRQVGTYPVTGTTVFGRSGGARNPAVVLDDRDTTLTRYHLSVALEKNQIVAEDFNSINGSYLKVDAERPLAQGDIIRIGGQQLTFKRREELPEKRSSKPVPTAPTAALEHAVGAPAPATTSAAARAGAYVTVTSQHIAGAIDAKESILTWADTHDVKIDSDCRVGKCGLDVIRIVSGAEHLNPVTENETKTLRRDGVSAGPCRLACMTKVSGPVEIEVVT